MRIDGVTGGTRTVSVHLPCSGVDLTLTIRPLPYGFQSRMSQEIPLPRPPAKQVRDRQGRPAYVYDERDPDYVKAMEKAQRLQSLCALRYALSEDTTVQWDTPFDESRPLSEIAKETEIELEKTDFPMADAVAIVQAVIQASGITTELLEERTSDFSRLTGGSLKE